MTALYENRELAGTVSDKLKIYAQPQRLMILSCLLRGEHNVAEIGEATGISQPALSQQLAELRRADLVSTRKESKLVHYSLANEGVGLCVKSMEAIFCGSEMPELPQDKVGKPSRGFGVKAIPSGAAGFAQIL